MVQSKAYQQIRRFRNCAVIVAHPDDETLWTGGTILMHPESKWTVVSLCRKSDRDRAPRFFRAVERLNANGVMGNLDDEPEQLPLSDIRIQSAILSLLPSNKFDLVITHSLWGEYSHHVRHEETGKAVLTLWKSGRLSAKQIWMFAYEDGHQKYLPQPIQNADLHIKLPRKIWQKKYNIITKIYGFSSDSFEAKTTPRKEAFWCFESNNLTSKIDSKFSNNRYTQTIGDNHESLNNRCRKRPQIKECNQGQT